MKTLNQTQNIGIYLFDQIEVLDFAGPFEVFSTASRVFLQDQPGAQTPFTVFTLGKETQPVHARGGLVVLPKYDLNNHPPVDVLILPGGVVSEELKNELLFQWISHCALTASIIASVCTGAFLLGKAGLLDGKQATTHWEDVSQMRDMFPNIEVLEETRWVDTGNIVSSAGISAGIDMSLHLVERLLGEAIAVNTARKMEFDWQNTGILS